MTSDLTERDYTVNIGQYFGDGWAIFKQYGGGFIGFIFVAFAINLVLAFIPVLGQIASVVIAGPLNAGFFIVAFKIAKNRQYTFGDFFRGFDNFLQLFLTNLVMGIFVLLGMLLLVIPGIYLAIAYAFAIALVVEKRLEFWDALETSRKIISKQWFSFFGLFFLIGLLNIAGAIAFGVGVLVTAPWSVCILAAAYKDVVGFNLADSGEA